MSAGVLTVGFGSITVASISPFAVMLAHETAWTTVTNKATKATRKSEQGIVVVSQGERVSEQRPLSGRRKLKALKAVGDGDKVLAHPSDVSQQGLLPFYLNSGKAFAVVAILHRSDRVLWGC